MGILQILLLLPVLIKAVELFFQGAKGPTGPTKWATVWKILKVITKYPISIMTDIESHDTEKLFSDITAILVEVANANEIFHHDGTSPLPTTVNKGS